MNTLIVYFSLEGNTKLIAEKIAQELQADIVPLTTNKKYPTEGVQKYVWGGKSIIFGDKPALTTPHIDLDAYETIFIGTPIWAGSFSPPIKTFLSEYPMTGKRIALFACHGGGGAEKCFKKIKAAIPDNTVIGQMDFVEPKNNPEEHCLKAVQWLKTMDI